MEVAGDQKDFIPIFTGFKKNNSIRCEVQTVINNLKKDKIIGVHLQYKKIPKYYLDKHDVNAVYKVELPNSWRLIYGILTIHSEKSALMMELFNHDDYNKRFGFKKR